VIRHFGNSQNDDDSQNVFSLAMFWSKMSAAATTVVTGTELFKLAESLGGVKSLLCHPVSMTHKSIPEEKRKAAGVADSLVRLSVGLEDVADLITDIDQALNKVTVAVEVASLTA
jgi:cystathionine beta-lyase